MSHFVHYLPRRIVGSRLRKPNPQWFGDCSSNSLSFVRPLYHTTRSRRGPAARVSPGDTIWMFSQLQAPWGTLPLCLDARIEVAAVIETTGGAIRFEAGDTSRWFPLFRTEKIFQLLTRNANGRDCPMLANPSTHYGIVLQSIRELANPTLLEDLEEELDLEPIDFVSYRIIDGTSPAFHLVSYLLNSGHRVFWDRWSLPRRLAERREQVDGDALNLHLLDVLAKSGAVWAVQSPLYAEPGSYSEKEFETAKSLGKDVRLWTWSPISPRL